MSTLLTIAPQAPERPKWLRAPAPVGENYRELKDLITDLKLHTVCESAACPNVGECWNRRTATFMILGNVCTRRCGFCAVQKGAPAAGRLRRAAPRRRSLRRHGAEVTPSSPASIATTAKTAAPNSSRLRSRPFASAFPAAKSKCWCPISRAATPAMKMVMDAAPDVLNHNTETVPRLYRQVRLGARYERSLDMLRLCEGAAARRRRSSRG